MLIVVATVFAVGCGGAPVGEQMPAVDAQELATRAPECAVSLLTPVPVAGGHCDVSPWDGAPGDQVFNLYSNAGGASVRASIRRSAPQGQPVAIGFGGANVWDWTHDCGEWAGIVVWSDEVTIDNEHPWIQHHEWSVSVDVSCVDDSYRIVGSWVGHI